MWITKNWIHGLWRWLLISTKKRILKSWALLSWKCRWCLYSLYRGPLYSVRNFRLVYCHFSHFLLWLFLYADSLLFFNHHCRLVSRLVSRLGLLLLLRLLLFFLHLSWLSLLKSLFSLTSSGLFWGRSCSFNTFHYY